MLRTAFIVRHVTLRIPVRISTGSCPRGEGVRPTTECDRGTQRRFRSLSSGFILIIIFIFKDIFEQACSLKVFIVFYNLFPPDVVFGQDEKEN